MAQDQPENSQRNPAEHLAEHRFRPGQTGNPGGRPKGRSITARLNDLLDVTARDAKGNEIPGLTIGDQIAQALAREAASGNVGAIRTFTDLTQGKPRQMVVVSEDEDARDALLDEALDLLPGLDGAPEDAPDPDGLS